MAIPVSAHNATLSSAVDIVDTKLVKPIVLDSRQITSIILHVMRFPTKCISIEDALMVEALRGSDLASALERIAYGDEIGPIDESKLPRPGTPKGMREVVQIAREALERAKTTRSTEYLAQIAREVA